MLDNEPLIVLTNFIAEDEVARWNSSPLWKPTFQANVIMVKTIIEAQLRVSNMNGGNAAQNQTPRAISQKGIPLKNLATPQEKPSSEKSLENTYLVNCLTLEYEKVE